MEKGFLEKHWSFSRYSHRKLVFVLKLVLVAHNRGHLFELLELLLTDNFHSMLDDLRFYSKNQTHHKMSTFLLFFHMLPNILHLLAQILLVLVAHNRGHLFELLGLLQWDNFHSMWNDPRFCSKSRIHRKLSTFPLSCYIDPSTFHLFAQILLNNSIIFLLTYCYDGKPRFFNVTESRRSRCSTDGWTLELHRFCLFQIETFIIQLNFKILTSYQTSAGRQVVRGLVSSKKILELKFNCMIKVLIWNKQKRRTIGRTSISYGLSSIKYKPKIKKLATKVAKKQIFKNPCYYK